MVMKQNGKILPAKIGPVPSAKRVNAGSCSVRPHEQDADASISTTPSLTNVLR